ncbi:mechanosensitive ion channel family protein [Candidatus Parvarchaeota archaeon]|nr:mechanosensitive ion channel family protein [Candidatus Parvarchaeota archaeon]
MKKENLNSYTKKIVESGIIIITILGVLLYIVGSILRALKLSLSASDIVIAVLTIIFGYFVIRLISNIISRNLSRAIRPKRATAVKFGFEIVSYIILLFIILSILGINPEGLLLGSAFIGLVIGLASQTVLSNLFAGILVMVAKPLEVGDRITLVNWQYNVIAPTYSPKFYSEDFVIPGYTGVVKDISLIYLVMESENKKIIKIPHGIFIQSLVINHSMSENSIIHVKYNMDSKTPPDKIISRLSKKITMSGIVRKKPTIFISEATIDYYVLEIQATVKSGAEQSAKSDILKILISETKKLRR